MQVLNRISYLFLFLSIFLASSLQAKESIPYVLVSVAPHQFFVEKIAGKTVKVGLIVPAGSSAHTYEPTPRQMIAASGACIWFRIGESFETKVIQALQSHNPDLWVVDLRQGLDLIGNDPSHKHQCCCHANAMDLHFWLSARMAQLQAKTIANALIEAYPEHANLYKKNLQQFEEELRKLDQDIQAILRPIKNRSILVSHPAYAYFCRDYELNQYSIEFEGKDPTPQQLHKTLNLARDLNIHTVFIQMQYNNKGARLIADEIGARLVILDPYSGDYLNSMRQIAQAFAEE
jgi:zinc transport system substrate-binding protein